MNVVYQIEFDEKGKADFKSLDNSIRLKIKRYFEKIEIANNPKAFGKPLENNLSGYWRYKVGDYRVVVEILDDRLIILVIAIGHRSKVYKETDKRLNK
jgi:mRNA interferase RelE/StbE